MLYCPHKDGEEALPVKKAVIGRFLTTVLERDRMPVPATGAALALLGVAFSKRSPKAQRG